MAVPVADAPEPRFKGVKDFVAGSVVYSLICFVARLFSASFYCVESATI